MLLRLLIYRQYSPKHWDCKQSVGQRLWLVQQHKICCEHSLQIVSCPRYGLSQLECKAEVLLRLVLLKLLAILMLLWQMLRLN